MTRRLESLTDEGLTSGGSRSTKRAIEDAGFSEELRKRLEERIANANFRNDFARELAQAELPTSAGAGTRDVAGARAWTGEESVEDASLRMLDDAIKPMRGGGGKPRLPAVPVPTRVDTGRTGRKEGGAGVRLADARERKALYEMQRQPGVADEEREKLRREMRERFQPGGRGGPMSIRALESMANERIEDAIARGQFKNLPRGQKLERDYNASNPFLDTTEYFMNKIIQKQEIVPPWIEKQQELVSTAAKFRSRLRADWKRHAARMIASKGGSLEKQIARAQAYAEAEKLFNPRRGKEEKLNAVDSDGHLSQISLAGELKATPGPGEKDQTEKITVTATPVSSADGAVPSPAAGTSEVVAEVIVQPSDASATTVVVNADTPPPPRPKPASQPFRDPAWEATERSFLSLSVTSLNSLTRSYNLMAPDLAKKPYFSLDRELAAAFADVAPQLPGEIRDRALEPKAKVGAGGRVAGGGVLERFGAGEEVKVWDDRKAKYGFREFWRDLFAKEK